MIMMKIRPILLTLVLIILSCGCAQLPAADSAFIKAFNITEDGDYLLEVGPHKQLSPAQKAVLLAQDLGANHVIFNPRAAMIGPFSNQIVPIIPQNKSIKAMSTRMVTFLKWVQAQGLTVQLRPIFFVVKDLKTLAPYSSIENGQKKNWFHGNIRPPNPHLWFDSLRAYHDIYLNIARLAQVEFYTIGAELYSMTVGIEGEWKEYPNGFPQYWNQFLKYVRQKVAPHTKIMYDVTYTDDAANAAGEMVARGGEFERWRHRLVDLATPPNANWYELKEFWSNLDAIGLDMYRSLAGSEDQLPKNYDELVKMLRIRTDRYANELASSLLAIELTLEVKKPIIFKEVGFRSAEKSFVNPFTYDNPREKLNLEHQAAAYQAFLETFFEPRPEWLSGVAFWDIGLNPKRRGEQNNGFTPIGKKHTEAIIMHFFK